MISAVHERCAGIDVGKKFLAVCVMGSHELKSGVMARQQRNWNNYVTGYKVKA